MDEHSLGWHNRLESLPLLFPLCLRFLCPESPCLYITFGCSSLTEVAEGGLFFFFFLPLQRVGTEKQPLDSHGSIHIPKAHCGPSWHISAPGASSKGGGFLHLPPP